MAHDIKKPQDPKEDRIKVSLKEMPTKVIPKEEPLKEQETPKLLPSKTEPLFQGKQLKKLADTKKVKSVQRPLLEYDEKKAKQIPKINQVKKTTQIEPSEISKPKIQLPPNIKPYIHVKPKKEPIKKAKTKYDSYDWLLDDKSEQEIKKEDIQKSNKNSINNSDIKEL